MLDTEQLREIIIHALEDIKGIDIQVLDVRGKSSLMDFMIIASGNTNRQVKALAKNIVTKVKEKDFIPLGIEGEQAGEWILVDLNEIVVHVMQPAIREFYSLEKLWGENSPMRRQDHSNN